MVGNRRIRIRGGEALDGEDTVHSNRVAGVHEPVAAYVQSAQHRDLARLKHAVEQSLDAVYITDSAGRIEFVSTAFEALTGFSRAESIGRPADYLNGHVPGLQAWFGAQIKPVKIFSAVVVQRRKQGDTFHADINVRPFVDMLGRITHYVATIHDVSARIKNMQHFEHLAYHDNLTGLPNRGLFRDRLQRALVHSARDREGFALLYLDIDHFKPINDRHGHFAGDRLLQEAAIYLSNSVREEDTVARIGGDEFVVIAARAGRRDSVVKVLDKIFAAFRCGGALISGRWMPMSVSIGVAIYPGDGGDEPTLLRRADHAMYRAKAAGGNHYCFFETDRDEPHATSRNLPGPKLENETSIRG